MSFNNSKLTKCVLFVALFTITLFNSPFASAQFTAELLTTGTVCNGSDISLNIVNGTAPYTITYNQNGNVIPVTASAPYQNPFKITLINSLNNQVSFNLVSVTDANGATATLIGNTNLLVMQPIVGLVSPRPLVSPCLMSDVYLNAANSTGPYTLAYKDLTNNNVLFFNGIQLQNNIPFPAGVFQPMFIKDVNGCQGSIGASPNVSRPVDVIEIEVLNGGSSTGTCNVMLNIKNYSGLTYQWMRNGQPVGGPMLPGIPVFTATQSGDYYVRGINTVNGCIAYSSYIRVTITSPTTIGTVPTITATPAATQATPYRCGQTVTLSVPATPAFAVYNWRKNFSEITTTTTPVFDVTSSGVYEVQYGNGVDCPSAFSPIAPIFFQNTVDFVTPVITPGPAVTTVCGTPVTLSVPNVYDTYQWVSFNGQVVTLVSGATTNTYTTQTAGTYSVAVTSGACNRGTAGNVTVTVTPLATPVLSNNGTVAVPFNSGQNTLSITSALIYDTYQWQTGSSTTTMTDIPGATGTSYTFTNGAAYYRVKVTKGSCTAYSTFFLPSISNRPAFIDPAFNTTSTLIMCASNAKLSVTPGYTYAWYKNGVLLAGETSSLLDLTKPGLGSGGYKALVTDNFNLGVFTNNMNVEVLADITPTLYSLQPKCTAQKGTISTRPLNVFLPSDFKLYKTYVWKDDQGNIIATQSPAANTGTGSILNLNPGTYSLTVTDWAGCTATASATINATTAAPDFTPVIQAQGGITSICKTYLGATGTVILEATNMSSLPPPVSGNMYGYQWLKDGVVVSSGLTPITSYSATQSGSYTFTIVDLPYFNPTNPVIPAGWEPTRCFGISNAINVDVITVIPGVTLTSTSNKCANTDLLVSFTGTTGPNATYSWNFGTAGDYTIVSGSGKGPYTIKYKTGGYKQIIVTATDNGCSASAGTSVTLLTPDPLQAQASSSNLIAGCSTRVDVYNGYVQSWSGGAFIPTTNASSITVNPATTTTYTFTGLDYQQCPSSGSIAINVLPDPSGQFSYPNNGLFCRSNASWVSPTYPKITGTGNSFTVSPSTGLVINAATGDILPGSSTANTYTITNKYVPNPGAFGCPVITSTATVTIYDYPQGSYFAYPNGGNVCSTSPNVSPTTQQAVAGTYTATPAGLVFANASTGLVDVAATQKGIVYTIRFTPTVNAVCAAAVYTEATLKINAIPVSEFSYPNPNPAISPNLFCNNSNITVAPLFPSYATKGQMYFTVSPGNLPFNSSTGAINPLNAGTGVYSIINAIPASNGCPQVSSTIQVTITAPKIAAPVTYTRTSFCEGETVILTPTISGLKGTLQISPAAGLTFNTSTGEINLTGALPNTYTITNSVNQNTECGGSPAISTTTITVKPKPVMTGGTASICSSGAFATSLSSTPAGSTFTWTSTVTSGSVSGYYSSNGNSINQSLYLSGTTVGTVKYTVTPTLNQCAGTPVDFIVTVNPVPVINTVPYKTICSGTALSIPLSTNIAGSTTSWTASVARGTVTGFSTATGTTITDVLTGSGTVTYQVTGSKAGCLSQPTSFQVAVNLLPAVTVTVPTDVCLGSQFTYSYTKASGMSNPAPTNIPSSSFSVISSNITSTGGTYTLKANTVPGPDITLTITNPSTACSTVTVSHVNVNALPVITANPLTVCAGSSFSLPITSSISGSTFSWTSTFTGTVSGFPASGTSSDISAAADAITGSGTITYTILATANGCTSAPKTVTVTVNPSAPITLTVTPTTLCEGTNVTVTRITPLGYGLIYNRPANFIPGTNTSGTTGTLNYTETATAGNSSGIFQVISTSPAGCVRTKSVPVTVYPAPIITASNVTICEGQGFDVPLTIATAGATFSWQRIGITGTALGWPETGTSDHITAATITGSGTITYRINSLSTQGCTFTRDVVVTVNPSLPSSLTVAPTTVCEGTNVTVSRSYPIGYTTTFTRPASFTLLGSGAGSDGVTVGVGETDRAGASGGDFIFTTTSPSGCSRTTTVHVDVLPVPTIIASNLTLCEGAATGFDIPLSSNLPGTTFTWILLSNTGTLAGIPTSGNGDHITATSITGNGTLAYKVNSLGSNGCTSTRVVTVTVNPNLPSFLTVSPTTVCEGATISAGISYPVGYTAVYTRAPGFTILGGGPASGNGYTGFNEGLRVGSSSGDFTLNVTSPAGCSTLITVHVTVLPRPNVSASNVTICEGAGFDIPVSSTASGVSYSWNAIATTGTVAGFPASGTSDHINAASITGNGTVTYRINSISINGCTSANINVTVTVNPNLPSFLTVNPTTVCEGSNVSASVSYPIGYSISYTRPSGFTILGGGGGQGNGYQGFGEGLRAGASSGDFILNVTSPAGCVTSSTVHVNVLPRPNPSVITYGGGTTICAGSPGGYGHSIEADVDYSVSFTDGLTSSMGNCGQNDFSYGCSLTWGNTPGYITVIATNLSGCSTTSQVFVPVQPTPVLNEVFPQAICNGGTTAINLNSTPNNTSINYTWESWVNEGTVTGNSTGQFLAAPGSGYTIQDILTGPGSVTYHITATNSNSCSSETYIFQEITSTSSPSVTIDYSPKTNSVPQVSLIVFTAYPVNCGSNPQYQWRVNGVNIAGATGATYQNPNLIIDARGNIADRVSCRVTSSEPCSNGVQVISNEKTIACPTCRMSADLTTEPAQQVQVYPNPFSESIHVNIPASFGEEVELVIKDMKGIEVERFTTQNKEVELGQHLGSGVYILQVTGKSGSETFKIVKTQ